LTDPERDELVLSVVLARTAGVLGHPSAAYVEPDVSFLDAGLTSFTALDLRNQICEATGLSLPPVIVFDLPTPRSLADHVHSELRDVIPPARRAKAAAAGRPVSGSPPCGAPVDGARDDATSMPGREP
jgi:hypothetical protein